MTSSTSPPRSLASGFGDLALDVGLPLALYLVLHSALGVALVIALAISSIPPAARTLLRLARRERVDSLALVMLALNLAGIATSLLTGNARVTFAKDSVVSSVAALAILIAALRGRSLMSDALQPFVVRGSAARAAAWDRLSAGSSEFRRCELRYSVIWGACLLGDCVVRLVGAVALPVHTMSWASTAILGAAVVLASIASGPGGAERIKEMVDAETPATGGRVVGAAGRPAA